jgi:hypothetical protein
MVVIDDLRDVICVVAVVVVMCTEKNPKFVRHVPTRKESSFIQENERYTYRKNLHKKTVTVSTEMVINTACLDSPHLSSSSPFGQSILPSQCSFRSMQMTMSVLLLSTEEVVDDSHGKW